MPRTPITRRRAVTTALAAAAFTGVGALPASARPDTFPRSRRGQGDRAHLEYQKRVSVRLQKALWQDGDTSLVDRFVSPTYIQHNPLAADGPEVLKAIAAAVHQQFPEETFDIVRVLAEGDLVVMHTHQVFVPGTPGRNVIDIVRFEHGRIAEHWDVIQDVPSIPSVNGHDMFATLSAPRTDQPGPERLTAHSKRVVLEYVNRLARQDLSVLDDLLAPRVIQHNPNLPDGAKATKAVYAEHFKQFPNLTFDLKRVVAEGDLVAVHAHLIDTPGALGQAVAEVFRVRDGKIIEHWDDFQDVPATSQNSNTMF
ncbi:nuclear transport factor 2 family protein [Streptomyces sp. VNUA24]|uniref:nuclear transport factor 2 family protein n=1 Tax=Streptomyces sp. VNUA24 TaxID=3031131 RepID=UPI0023B8633A|nr:nuclear transport factor 2 family protein [Streptomyces sp. VNUA24]WEH12965.1 ester cyclase [Streptomyces sp. VNUA24]